jgi:hypothetical protein
MHLNVTATRQQTGAELYLAMGNRLVTHPVVILGLDPRTLH